MSFKLNRRAMLASTAAFGIAAATGLRADGHTMHTVEMLNKDPDNPRERMVYSPNVIRIKAGDSVMFKSTDRGHNAEAMEGMVPDGAEEFATKINSDEEVTFATPGVYGVRCTPHYSTGMVMLVVVEGEGMLDNVEAAKGVRQRGRAKQRFDAIWEKAEAEGYLDAASS